MAHPKVGHEIVGFVKDGKIRKFQIKVQGKQMADPIAGPPTNLMRSKPVSAPSTNLMRNFVLFETPSKSMTLSQGQKPSTSTQRIPIQFLTNSSIGGQKRVPPQIGTAPPQILVGTPSRKAPIISARSSQLSTSKIVTSSKHTVTNIIQTLSNLAGKADIVPNQYLNFQRRARLILDSPPPIKNFEIDDLETENNDVSLVDIEDDDSLDDDDKEHDIKCTECSRCFYTTKELNQHEKLHIGESNYICDQCGREFSMKQFFDKHLLSHASEKKFECDTCHKRFDYRDNLIFHMRIHGDLKSYKCHFCNKKFGNKSMRDNHLLKHNELNTDNAHSIPDGGKVAQFIPDGGKVAQLVPNSRKVATFIPNSGKVTTFIPNSGQVATFVPNGGNIETIYDSKSSPFPCNMCEMRFPNKLMLENHKTAHVEHQRQPKLDNHKTAHNGHQKLPKPKPYTRSPPEQVKYVCKKCNKIFFREHYFKCHTAMCGNIDESALSKAKSVKCAFCKKNYTVLNQSKDDGSQSLKFICEPCCTFLAQKSQVSGFTPRLENRFICNKCDKCFACEEELRQHLDCHLSGAIFECDKCDRCFGNEKALEAHKEFHTYLAKEKGISESNKDEHMEYNTLIKEVKGISESDKDEHTEYNTLIKEEKGISESDKDVHKDYHDLLTEYNDLLTEVNDISKHDNDMHEESENENSLDPPIRGNRSQNSVKNRSGGISNSKSGKASKRLQRSDCGAEIPRKSRAKLRRVSNRLTEESPERNSLSPDITMNNVYSDTGGQDSDSSNAVEMPEYDPFGDDDPEMQDLKFFIKEEPKDFDEPEDNAMDNCTVFSAATPQDKAGTAFCIPDQVIKKEPCDDDNDNDNDGDDNDGEEQPIQVKLENMSDDDMTIKEEEDDMDFSVAGFPVKEDKLDASNEMLPNDFEFTPFGDVKREDFLNI